MKTACPDWADRIRAGKSLIPPPLFHEQAERALGVFKALRIVDAAGSPTFGEACAPWVFDLVASIFGAYDPDTGVRHISEWFVLIPKKNSKSTIAAGIMMTALILNWRQSAEYSILAPTVEVAGNSFSPARDMCAERHDAELGVLMHAQSHVKTITHRETRASLKVLAADSNTVGGSKSVAVLVDELWLFGSDPNAENMLREATGGLASRPEGFAIYLTTQSDDIPAGVFLQKLNYARAVRDGEIKDDRFVPVIYEFPKDMVDAGDHLKPENFWMVNPNMRYSVSEDFLRREYGKAQNDGDASMRGFLAKHLNVQIGQMLGAGRWAGANYWEQSAAPGGLTLEALLERSDVATVGVDGGGLDDLLGLAVVGRERDTGRWLSWCRAWAHPQALKRNKAEAARFQDFAASGDLVLVERIGEDVQEVAAICAQVHNSGILDKVGVDPAGIGAILDALDEAGIPADRVVGISQGWKMTGAIKTTERKLAEGALHHDGSPLMAWCVGNAKVEPAGNAVKITKQASGSAKIDPLMALFNAVSLMALNPQGSGIGSFLGFLQARADVAPAEVPA